MRTKLRPPRLARRLLERALPPEVKNDVSGDLIEVFRQTCTTRGPLRARIWYWREALVFSGRFVRERLREARLPWHTWDAFRHELRLAVRGVVRAPGFAATAILTLAVGIGVNQVMLRVIDRILLRPPEHVEDAGRVVRVFQRGVSPPGRLEYSPSTGYPDYRDLHGAPFFEYTAGYAFDSPVVGVGTNAERLLTQWATADLFPLLGVEPALGRFFSAADDRVGVAGSVVLAWSHWMQRFGGDPGVLGRDLRIGEGTYTVVGVAPRGFTGPELAPVKLWIPLHVAAGIEAGSGWETARVWMWIRIVARLAPGVSHDAAATRASLLVAGVEASEGLTRDRTLVFTSLMAADEPEVPTWAAVSFWLAGVSILVWAIAAANVANLLLARQVARRRETAVRLALGASRRRVLWQFLIEALVLAVPSALVALLVAFWGSRAVQAVLLPDLSLETTGDGGRILVFTIGTALLSGAVAGLVPGLQARRRELTDDLKTGARGGGEHSRVQDRLLVSQVALSVVMLVAAGLFVRSLQGIESRTYLGVDADPIVLSQVFLGSGLGTDAESVEVFRAVVERAERIPGVDSAAATTFAPFSGGRGVQVRLPGGDQSPDPPDRTIGPDQVHVTADFFRTLGMEILAGRGLSPADGSPGAQRVAVVSRSMANHYWPGVDSLGECVWIETEQDCTTIVGISSDIPWNGPAWRPTLLLYLPLGRRAVTPRDVLIRFADGHDIGLAPLREALRSASPRIRFVGVQRLSAVIATHTAPWLLGAAMCSLFGGLALVVAGVGLYGVMAFRVARRRHEIAVRGALGATPGRITGMVLRQGGGLMTAGIVTGLVIAALSSQWIAPLLFGVSALDPAVYFTVAAALLAVGIVASSLPAHRASRVDPMLALRAH